MGAVYRGHRTDGGFEQVVAVKILPAWATEPNAVKRLGREEP